MKIIKLQESQFQRVFEGKNGNQVPSFNGGDMKEYNGSETKTTTNITNSNGDIEYGKQPTTDEFANQLTTQSYYANRLKNSRVGNTY
jgi:hypothetical protein